MLYLQLLILLILILLNGFFAMSELAIVSARRSRLQQMADEGRQAAARALQLLDDPTGFLSTVQIGITLIGIFAGAYSGATLAQPLADWLGPLVGLSPPVAGALSFAVVVIGTTYLSLIIGELVPKQLALNHAEGIAMVVSGPMHLMAKVGLPVVWLLRLSTNSVLRLLGITGVASSRVTEDDIRALILEGAESGVVKPAEHEMLQAVMLIADRPVRSIMVPRPEVTWLRADDPLDEWRRIIRDAGHNRYPLYGDTIDDIIGIIHVKDLITEPQAPLRSLAREPLYVSEGMQITRVLEAFKSSPVHMAIVLDEYGGFQGIVTPSDVLIAIAGDFAQARGEDSPEAVRREDGSWLLDGGISIDNAVKFLDGVEIDEDRDFVTLAGFVLERLGYIPEPGECFDHGEWSFEVVDLDGRRIDKVIATRHGTGGVMNDGGVKPR
jgi:putative hemolysin